MPVRVSSMLDALRPAGRHGALRRGPLLDDQRVQRLLPAMRGRRIRHRDVTWSPTSAPSSPATTVGCGRVVAAAVPQPWRRSAPELVCARRIDRLRPAGDSFVFAARLIEVESPCCAREPGDLPMSERSERYDNASRLQPAACAYDDRVGAQPPRGDGRAATDRGTPSVPTPFVVLNEFAAVRWRGAHSQRRASARSSRPVMKTTVDLCPLELEPRDDRCRGRAELVRCDRGQGRGADVAAG